MPLVVGPKDALRLRIDEHGFDRGGADIHTEDDPAANAAATGFTALRLKRNVLGRSNLGVIATRRGPAAVSTSTTRGSGDPSYTIGADATLLFFKSINLTGYAAKTRVPDRTGRTTDGASYRGRFDYTNDRYGLAAEHMLIDAGFNPEMGFTRRTDVRRSYAQARFSQIEEELLAALERWEALGAG